MVVYTDRLVTMVRRFLNMVAVVLKRDVLRDDGCCGTHF